jgi:hypothetical protein
MKTFFVSLLLVVCLAFVIVAQQKQGATASSSHEQHAGHTAATATDAETNNGDVIKRGAPLGDSPSVAFADVLKEPQKYADKVVTIEGVAERVCTSKGCWMEIAPKAGAESVRVTFKDYGFFVPTSSKNFKVKAEGKFAVKVLTKEKADHYEGEGARIKRNADGTANEVTFVAVGVELRKS